MNLQTHHMQLFNRQRFNGSNITLGCNTQYVWGGGSAPQNMYFPDESTAVSEATAVSNISSTLSNYNQISAIASNYMDRLSAKVISGYSGVNLPGIEVVWNGKYGSGRIVGNMPGAGYVTASVDGNWISEVWGWTKDHFYICAEGEITYGVQLSGIVYKGYGLNINPVSQVVAEGKLSNKDSYSNNYPIVPPAHMYKGKALDFGAAGFFGGNYNWNIENGKYVSSTISIGIIGLGGNLTWDKSGVSNLFLGFEAGGKLAFVWGAGGSFKIGFNWDW